MGTVLIHAGMPKAGSSAVQDWLRKRRELLAEQGVDLLAVKVDREAGAVEVVPYRSGHVNSGVVIEMMRQNRERRMDLARAFVEGLERRAEGGDTVVITSEAFAQPFWQGDETVLGLLNDLAKRHRVVVGYYVRPQHTALEAAWRQWGFRTPRSPAEYVSHRAGQLDYRATLETVAQLAPSIDFRMRPFRRDLLEGNDVVDDFATHVLGVRRPDSTNDSDANVGLPLELVNLLAEAPPGLLGASPHDNRRFRVVKELLAGVTVETAANVTRGQEVLQRWCHDRFEEGNLELVSQLGWPTDSFVPAVLPGPVPIDRLDRLWRPEASPMERWALFQFLDEALACREREPDEGLRERLRAATTAADQLRAEAADARRRGEDIEDRLRQLEDRRSVRMLTRLAALASRLRPSRR